jgi:hypothetical protein
MVAKNGRVSVAPLDSHDLLESVGMQRPEADGRDVAAAMEMWSLGHAKELRPLNPLSQTGNKQ